MNLLIPQIVMMYISVLPLAISIRRTNVYEEHSLGIYVENTPEVSDGDEGKYIMAHVRRQLEFDLWYVFLGLFLICVAEGGRIADANDYVCPKSQISSQVECFLILEGLHCIQCVL